MDLATRTDSRRTAMRDRILDATERLLARLGYQKMTMDDVAHEAGISKRTIYVHFPSKEEVALGSIDRIVERLKGRLKVLASGGGGPAERLRRMLLERVLFRFDSVRDYYQGIDEIFRSLRAAYMARRRRYFDEEARLFAEVLSEGRDSGALALDDPLATAHALLQATNALLPSALSARELGDRNQVRQQADRIADLLLSGLLARDPAPRPGDSKTHTRDGGS
jgi:AcrR family transcriptional regulator